MCVGGSAACAVGAGLWDGWHSKIQEKREARKEARKEGRRMKACNGGRCPASEHTQRLKIGVEILCNFWVTGLATVVCCWSAPKIEFQGQKVVNDEDNCAHKGGCRPPYCPHRCHANFVLAPGPLPTVVILFRFYSDRQECLTLQSTASFFTTRFLSSSSL